MRGLCCEDGSREINVLFPHEKDAHCATVEKSTNQPTDLLLLLVSIFIRCDRPCYALPLTSSNISLTEE